MSDLKERLTRKKGIVKRSIAEIGDVWIRALSTNEVLELAEEKDPKRGTHRTVAACVVDEDGAKLFTPDEVGALDWSVTRALSEEAMAVNGLKVADAEKKSTTPPSSP